MRDNAYLRTFLWLLGLCVTTGFISAYPHSSKAAGQTLIIDKRRLH